MIIQSYDIMRKAQVESITMLTLDWLAYMGTSAALAAIPDTDPPRYVVAGTLADIVKLLPAAEVIHPSAAKVGNASFEGLTRYMFTFEGMEVDNACGRYYLVDDVDALVERLAVPPLTAPAPLTDELRALVDHIADLFNIGSEARTPSTILTNVRNTIRRAECLVAVERQFFMAPLPPDDDYPDDEPGETCLLNWGDTPEQYAQQFGEVLPLTAPAPQTDAEKLIAEARAVFDLMLEGCREQNFGDFQNGDGEEIGPRMDALHARLRAYQAAPLTAPAPLTDDYRQIAHLIGSIFFAGDFKAETANERELEALLIKTGHRYASWDEVIAKAAPAAPVQTDWYKPLPTPEQLLAVARDTGLRSYLHGVNSTEAKEILYNYIDAVRLLDTGYLAAPVQAEQAQAEPVAWARKWHVDGETPAKEKNENNRLAWPQKFKFHAVTPRKVFKDDVPLYATPELPAQAEQVAAVRAARHPVQPLVIAEHGRVRFKRNHIVEHLAEGKLNDLAAMDFPQEDWEQLAQLIGYSLDGFGTLSYVTDETYERAASQDPISAPSTATSNDTGALGGKGAEA